MLGRRVADALKVETQLVWGVGKHSGAMLIEFVFVKIHHNCSTLNPSEKAFSFWWMTLDSEVFVESDD